jgi:hypothetical protein
MNFGLSFSYVFKDPDWFKKVAIPALCGLIPVVGQFVVAGWALKATKNVIDGNEEHALPELEFGPDLGRGFMSFLIGFIYGLIPAILMSFAGGLFGWGADVYEEALMIIMYIAGGCLGLVGILVGLLFGFLGMTGIANYVAKGEFKAAFQFKELFAMIKKSFVSWLLVLLGAILTTGIIAPLGSIACGIGVLLTTAYANVVYAHLLGQAYNKSKDTTFEAVETL